MTTPNSVQLIQIVSRASDDPPPTLKVAYVTEPMIPSNETENEAARTLRRGIPHRHCVT